MGGYAGEEAPQYTPVQLLISHPDLPEMTGELVDWEYVDEPAG